MPAHGARVAVTLEVRASARRGPGPGHDAGPRVGRVRVRGSLAGLLEDNGGDVVGIDMPLGLLESGWREADQAARGLLGARRSSVFAIPQRAGVGAAGEIARGRSVPGKLRAPGGGARRAPLTDVLDAAAAAWSARRIALGQAVVIPARHPGPARRAAPAPGPGCSINRTSGQ
jgi:predicted RNase H-like nuclease